MYKIISAFIMLAFIAVFNQSARATETAGEIVKIEGNVLLYAKDTVRGKGITPGSTFMVGDSIKTKQDSYAFIRMIDGSKAVIKPDSIMKVIAIDRNDVEQGTVLFEIKKQGRAKGVTISSKTVTMGVKGTRFGVVADDQGVAIFLKEGLLEIGSLSGEFKKHLSSLKDEMQMLEQQLKKDFETTTEQMKKQFEQDKKDMQAGNYEIVRQFNMESGNAVSILGNEARDIQIPPSMEEDFKLLDTF
ncbi:MAG: FecR family protein [Proteobacteria bacterium]|nr:FecR family protein [Pseudomonadota bacterium]MBU1714880.1 FecR family protein [Pseudomonadota bacterium]